jgi:hypothetical protein
MNKIKCFDLMVAELITMSDKRRDVIQSQADRTELVENILLKGYSIAKGRKFYAKNLEPTSVV